MRAVVVAGMLAMRAAAFGASCEGAGQALAAGRQALERDDAAAAARALAPLEASHPQCPEVWLDLARLRAAQSDDTAAENLFFKYQDLAPKDAKGFFYFAEFLLARGQYARADTMSEVAVSLDPNEPAALVLKARILTMKGQMARAQEFLQNAVRLDPRQAEAHFQLGVIFDGHPDPRRILCPEDWVGYPLRKDYEYPLEYHGIPGTTEFGQKSPRH